LGLTLTEAEIDQKSKEMNQWLSPHCKGILHQLLQELLLINDKDLIQILKLHYGKQLNKEQVALELQIPESLVNYNLAQVKENLQIEFQKQLQDRLGISLALLRSPDKQIITLVDEWLKVAPYESYKI
ncbi:hypothetical protein LC605_30255, partial [Nostoc sp. CHAB 5836]|uniref:hypothetical protein n=1 Tax=Nostoc sp. CHAB 5836 TaxID=2780404 RepID=UPI001E606A11